MDRVSLLLAMLFVAFILPANTLAQSPPDPEPVYVGQILGMQGVSLEVNDMLRERPVDPTDPGYLARAGAAWVVYQAMDKTLRVMTPPAAFIDTHALLLSATGYLSGFAPQCIPVFLQGDPAAVQPCVDYLQEGKMQLLMAFIQTMVVADSLGIWTDAPVQ
jgi:hypothetical protein